MIIQLLGIGLLAQTMMTPVQAYTTFNGELATDDGRYSITWGHNCDAIPLGGNVEMWRLADVPSQAVLAPMDETGQVETIQVTDDGTAQSLMCSVALTPLPASVCATDELGKCNFALDSGGNQ